MINILSDIDTSIVAKVSDEIANTSGPIVLRFSSSGGDVNAALAAYEILKSSGRPVRAEIIGLCASAATVVAMAATERLISPSALMMTHAPWMQISGNAGDLNAAADLLTSIEGNMSSVYAAALGITPAAACELMQGDNWYTADQAIAAGLATGLMPSLKVAASLNKQGKHNMSAWKTLLAKISGKPEISEEVRNQITAEIKAQITCEEEEELTELKASFATMEKTLEQYQEQVASANGMKARIAELEAKATTDEAMKEEAVAKVDAVAQAAEAIVASGLTVAAFRAAIAKPTAKEILAAIESGEKIKAPEAIKKTEASGKLQVYASISDPVERQKFLAEHKAEIEAEKLSLKTR